MITEADVAQRCPERTMQRARQIAEKPRNIVSPQCRLSYGETKLLAFVAASSGWTDRYRVQVALDEDHGEVLDFACTCPASMRTDGMCKHTAALALAYLHEPERFAGFKRNRAPETSPSITAFMHRAERAAHDDVPAGSVRIDVTLSYGFENWSARFKIRGPQSSYVMKSISDFAEAFETGAVVTYGKRLSFAHTLGAFDARSRRLVSFIRRAVERRSQQEGTLSWHTRSRRAAVGRALDLSEEEAVDLVDLVADAPFDLDCTDGSMPAHQSVTVVDEDPRVPLRIEREEDGGYLIERDEAIVFACAADRMIVLRDATLHRCTPSFARVGEFLRSVYRSNDDSLFIAPEDAPLFCATVLPLLEDTIGVDAPPELEALRPVPGELAFYFDRAEKVIYTVVQVAYSAHRFTLLEPSVTLAGGEAFSPEETDRDDGAVPLRDEVLERRGIELARTFFDADATLSLDDDDAVAELFLGGLARFRALGTVFTTPAFDRIVSSRKPRLQIGLSLAGDLVDLDVSADDLDPADLAGVLASYRKRKRFHRLRDGAFLDLADMDLHELSRMMDDLGIASDALAAGHVELPTYRAFFLDREFSDARRSASFESYVNRFRTVKQSDYEPPADLQGTLRPYQLEGFRWLSALTDLGFGGILADEMGLGKSIQLISLLLARRDEARNRGPTLITCPASLVYNWLAEFAAFAPSLTVRAVEGPPAERARIRAERGVDVFVVSYDLVRVDAEAFESRSYWCHVIDEAQYIKNHATLTTRAVKRIRSAHRFALTGTPIENRLSEIWSIFDFLMPGFLGTYERFRKRFELGIVGGDEEAAHTLRSLVEPFVLRRLKRDVLPDLPDKIDSVIFVPLDEEQRRLYLANEQSLRESLNHQKKNSASRTPDPALARNRIEVLAELTKLRQIALDPALLYENYRGGAAKTRAILDLIEQTRASGEKALVFSQFTSYLDELASELAARGVAYYTITGSTPKKERLERAQAFNDDDVPVFLVSLKAGGTGLNLIGASVVIHADPWWNAAAVNQATDRAHRIGQTDVVTVYKMIAKGTIEERILSLQERKAALADAVVGQTGAAALSSLTREELMELLEG